MHTKEHTEEEMRYVRGSRGQAFLVSIIFFVVASSAVAGGVARPVITDVKLAKELEQSKQSYSLAEAGAEDAAYRIQNGLAISTTEVLSENGVYATTTITDTIQGFDVQSVGDQSDRIRTINASFIEGEGVSFNYGIQAGLGGFVLTNSASVRGNAYSNGPIQVSNSGTIYGDVVSAGPSGLVSGLTATGTVYAHTIENSDIGGDAYYMSISGSTVDGTQYPNSSDQATSSLPISDEMVEIWKAEAVAGGVHSSPCSYTITTTVSLGPQKIACDLIITGTAIVTLLGAVWVEGDITISNSAIVRVSSSLGARTVPIIADKPSAPTTSGLITVSNSATFQGSGTSPSYVLLLSQNTSAESGGSTIAITVSNFAAGGFLVYAGHGEIELSNNMQIKEVTAYRVRISNSAQVIYETGLANLLFTSGPSSGFSIGGWGE